MQCHRYEIFQVNALIGVFPFSDWPCWGSRTVCIKCYSSHLLGNWWKGDLLLKWRNCVTLHSLEICGFHLLLFVNCRLLSHQFQGNVYITLGTFAIRWLAITTYHFKGQNPWWWLLFKFFCGDITSQQSFLLLTELGLRLQPFWLLWQLKREINNCHPLKSIKEVLETFYLPVFVSWKQKIFKLMQFIQLIVRRELFSNSK